MSAMSFIHCLSDDGILNACEKSDASKCESIQLLLIDMQFIFSSRCLVNDSDICPEMSHTILGYGIHDVNSVDYDSDSYVEKLRSDIFNAIQRFEPRLKDSEVSFERRDFEQIFFLVKANFYSKMIELEIAWSNTAHYYSIIDRGHYDN